MRWLLVLLVVWSAAMQPARGRPSHGEDATDDRPSDRVHIFYYNWYGAPPHQNRYVHWTQGEFAPPEQIGANFYPQLGAYSSSDPQVLRQHMAWLRKAGVGVLSLTWWGQGSYEDQLTRPVLDAAAEAGLQVNFHLEPYHGSTPQRFAADVRYLLETYGSHPAFYRARQADDRPMYYVFRALDHDAATWRVAMEDLQALPEPPLMIAQTADLTFIVNAGFDGGYTYDVLHPFHDDTFFDRWVNEFAPAFAAAGKLFIPSVGPGYWDERAVPVDGANPPATARSRDAGTDATYLRGWAAAGRARVPFVTITSFNEWHEGSQIEPAVEYHTRDYTYPGYEQGPLHYLHQTAEAVQRFTRTTGAQSVGGIEHMVVIGADGARPEALQQAAGRGAEGLIAESSVALACPCHTADGDAGQLGFNAHWLSARPPRHRHAPDH